MSENNWFNLIRSFCFLHRGTVVMFYHYASSKENPVIIFYYHNIAKVSVISACEMF